MLSKVKDEALLHDFICNGLILCSFMSSSRCIQGREKEGNHCENFNTNTCRIFRVGRVHLLAPWRMG